MSDLDRLWEYFWTGRDMSGVVNKLGAETCKAYLRSKIPAHHSYSILIEGLREGVHSGMDINSIRNEIEKSRLAEERERNAQITAVYERKGGSINKSLGRYEKQLALAQDEVSEKASSEGGLGVDGWKRISFAQSQYLYHLNKINTEVAMKMYAHKLTVTDHAKHLQIIENVEHRAQEIVALGKAGVEISKVIRRMERLAEKPDVVELKPEKTYGLTADSVKYKKPVNQQQQEVNRALGDYDRALLEKERKLAPRLAGRKVELSDEEKAELIARHKSKGKAIRK